MALGFLMTGGAGSRMRRQKAFLDWYDTAGQVLPLGDNSKGASLAVHLCGVLGAVCSEVFLVGNSEVGVAGVARLNDAVSGAGPLGGLLSALRAPGDVWRVVLSCDTPFVTPSLLGRLLTLAKAREADGCDAVIPLTKDGQRHPLCAIYHRRVEFPLRSLLDVGRAQSPAAKPKSAPSMHKFIASLQAEVLPVDDSNLLRNLNTMQEYLAALGDLRHGLRGR